ncbi:MAG: heme/copper-type cytochrome/quinol oxidase subunit 2 [Alphaproteobacteria bacterium]|jgi:heme/copper-type cytochrome/quinol oxidase subunit 2
MPITVEAVSEEDFKKWVAKAQKEFARVDEVAAPKLAKTKSIIKDATPAGIRLAQSRINK